MVQFSVLDGKRKTIRLGKMNKRRAERIKDFIEDLVEAHMSGQRPMAATAEWVAGLPLVIRQRLERVGLVTAERRAARPTLGEWLSAYIDGRTDAKQSTRTVWGHTRRNLLDFFGKDKPIDAITPGDADQWRLSLIDQENLADNTVRRRCGIAKQFFNFARRKRLITDNPFADLKALVQSNRQRDYFVTRQEAQGVLEACPDAEWRLIFALSRFGGLRCPSEHLALTWGDIHWAEGRFTVHSPKTEHHPGGESRQVPLFPELLPHLREVFELAARGRVRHHPLPAEQPEPEHAVAPHHQAGRPDALAETVPEPSGEPRDGTRRNVSPSRGLCLDRELPGRGRQALPSGDRGSLPQRAAKCAAASTHIEPKRVTGRRTGRTGTRDFSGDS